MAVERRRFTVTDYERMAATGILTEDDRVELIAGEIVEMSPIGVRHMQCVNRLTRMLSDALPATVQVSVQNPIRLLDDSEPQPDIAVLYDHDYAAIPAAGDTLLVIEVADSSRDFDRGMKIPLYGAAGIPEAWLIDLVSERIERYTEPTNGHYRFAAFAARGESLASTAFPALTLAVDTILG